MRALNLVVAARVWGKGADCGVGNRVSTADMFIGVAIESALVKLVSTTFGFESGSGECSD